MLLVKNDGHIEFILDKKMLVLSDLIYIFNTIILERLYFEISKLVLNRVRKAIMILIKESD